MKLKRLALAAAIGMFSMAAYSQSMTVLVPGTPVAAGATGNATVRFAGTNIAGAQFRLCYDAAILTPGTPVVPAGLAGLVCNAPTAGNCPANTTNGINCAGFVNSGVWTFPQDITFPFTVAAGATGTGTALAFGSPPIPLFADGNGNDVTPTTTGASFPYAGVVITPPTVAYNPNFGTTINFPAGVAGVANSSISLTPSGGSGTGTPATTTVNNCVASAGFTIGNAPINFSFVGNTTTPQSINLSCTRGAAAQTGTLTCDETRGAAAAVQRSWNLACPVAVPVSGPTLGYNPAAGGTVAFGTVVFPTPGQGNQNIVVTPSGGGGGGTTTLGSCAVSGAQASQFTVTSAATLTFTAGTNTPQNLSVRYTPTAAAAASATLTCTETVQNGATTPRTWTLSGTGQQQAAQFSANPAPPGPVAFGSVIVGANATRTITVSNPAPAGSASLPLIGCTVANAAGVTVSPTSLNVAPQGSGTLTLTYAPTAAAALPANATLTCSDPLVLEASRVWNLTGTAVNPLTSSVASGATITVGGTAPQNVPVTFTNTGPAALTLACTAPAAPFVVNPLTLSVPANGTAQLSVGIGQGNPGNYTGTLSCTVQGVGQNFTFNLAGTIAPPVAVNAMSAVGLWAMLGLLLGTGLVMVSTRKQ